MKRVAVLDPGRCKCGLVLADLQLGLVCEGHVVAPDAVEAWLEHWNQNQALDRILIGDGTGSRAWIQRLERLGHLTVIPEQGTTLRARQRYWTLWPARGWRRMLPAGLRIPPVDLDAVAALVMLEEHLQCLLSWPEPAPSFALRSGPGP